MTGSVLELFTDIDIVQFTEKDMRDGVSQIVKKYSEANNKYIKSND